MCALLLILTAQRVQTIHLMKLSFVKIHETGCTILIVDKLRSTRLSFHLKALELKRFEEKKLCVVDCLEQYTERTKMLKREHDKLFLLSHMVLY